MNNLHISLTEFRNESRVIKETTSIASSNMFNNVYIAALHSADLLQQEEIDQKIILNRFRLASRKIGKNLPAQLLKFLEYIIRICLFYREKQIGMVNVHALGLLPLGVLLKYSYNAKLIYDTHELETETNGLGGMRKKLAKWIERFLINKVDYVFVVSESIADWYEKEYKISRPTVVMNAPNLINIQPRNYFREKLSIPKETFILLYQGGLFKGRGVDIILSAFTQRADKKVCIVFMGYGDLEAEIEEAASRHDNIYFHPAVPTSVVLEYTASADAGIHMIRNTCLNHYYCMPNKLFEYAMAGIPVIVSNMKDMREFVKGNNIGVIVKDDSIDELNKAIDAYSKLDIKKLKLNARKAAEENAWNIQEEIMINAYREILV